MSAYLPAHEVLLTGLPDQREKFKATHPDFVACLDRLAAVGKKTFLRTFPATALVERIIFFGGIVCSEEFAEIVLLAANGQGVGALKPLRSLYERTVTLLYLSRHPEEAERFHGYFDIELGKHLSHAKEDSILRAALSEVPKDVLDEIEANYATAKSKYVDVICKVCGTSRTMFRWSTLDLKSMAREAKFPGGKLALDSLYLPCFVEPTLHAHSTVSSIVRRVVRTDDGRHVLFDPVSGSDWSSHCAMFGHQLLVIVLDNQNRVFKLGLDAEIQTLFADFMKAWGQKAEMGESTSASTETL